MARIRNVATGRPAQTVVVTIRHAGEWDEGRHGTAFLRPIVDGARRRLATAAALNVKTDDRPPG